jgi:hypothetical protein
MWLYATVSVAVALSAVVLARIGVYDHVARAVLALRARLRAADDEIFGR